MKLSNLKLMFLLYKMLYEIIFWIVSTAILSKEGIVSNPVYFKFLLSYAAFGVLLAYLPSDRKKISTHLISVMFLFIITPLLSYYWQTDSSTLYMFYVFLSFMTTLVVYKRVNFAFTSKIRTFIEKIRFKYPIENVLFIAILLLIFMISLTYGWADLRALDFQQVYDVRSDREYSMIWGYLVNWLSYSIIPTLMCISLFKNDKKVFLFAILAQTYMYLFTANKTTLLSILLLLAAYYFTKRLRLFSIQWIMLLFFGQLTSLIVFWFSRSLALLSIIPLRLSYIPAQLSFRHFLFFNSNPKLWFSENLIGRLLGVISPYKQFSTYMLSGIEGVNANTGYLGDAFDNGGLLVMLLYSIIIAIVFHLIDTSYNLKFSPVIIATLTYSMIILNDAPLLTTFLTGGLILNIVILKIFNNQNFLESP